MQLNTFPVCLLPGFPGEIPGKFHKIFADIYSVRNVRFPEVVDTLFLLLSIIDNGTRQVVLSPSVFSRQCDCTNTGCHVGSFCYNVIAFADDLILCAVLRYGELHSCLLLQCAIILH